jgi:hypothetical protein
LIPAAKPPKLECLAEGANRGIDGVETQESESGGTISSGSESSALSYSVHSDKELRLLKDSLDKINSIKSKKGVWVWLNHGNKRGPMSLVNWGSTVPSFKGPLVLTGRDRGLI